jgi:hypothetical protein
MDSPAGCSLDSLAAKEKGIGDVEDRREKSESKELKDLL